MALPQSAKAHFDLCLKERKHYTNGRSHCRLAKLYEDYDQQKCDIVELEFQVKWNKVRESADVFARILRLKTHPSEEAWKLFQRLLLNAFAKQSAERAVFGEIPAELFESIISGLTKHFGNDMEFMSQLYLFVLEMSSEDKYAKLANRAISFLIKEADSDTNLHDGVSLFHILIAVYVAPLLLERRIAMFQMDRVFRIIVFTVQVAVSWPSHHARWLDALKELSPIFQSSAIKFSQCCWDIVRDLLVKFISAYELGALATLQTNPSNCEGFLKSSQNLETLKAEAKKLVRFVFVWRAYCVWKKFVKFDELLVWTPENRWNGEVNKIIDDSPDASSEKHSPPAKKAKTTRERRSTSSTNHTEIPLVPTCDELSEAYGLCCISVSDLVASNGFVESASDHLLLTEHFLDVHKFISESLIFKSKYNEAIIYLNERILEKPEEGDDIVVNVHLACANALERNWDNAFSVLATVLSHGSGWVDDEKEFKNHARFTDSSQAQAKFCILKTSALKDLVYDLLHHVFYKVYTSTAVDHENDELLGSLLVLSQVNFYAQGCRSFNRIMRHIEAKGSLNYPGLAKYITNVTILEELARIQEYCSEYVSIQVAVPQVQRRIGQSTRHSVRGTRDGQKQSLEEQIRKEGEAPLQAVIAYFEDNQESILKILRNR